MSRKRNSQNFVCIFENRVYNGNATCVMSVECGGSRFWLPGE